MGGSYNISGTTTVTNGTHSLAAANLVDLGDILNISGGSLDLGALSPTVTSLNQSGGTLGGTGTLTVSGASTLSTPGFSQASMTGTGTTRFDGALAITGGGLHDLTGGRRLLTTGTTTWTNSSGNAGQFRLGGGAVIENRGLWLDDTTVSTSINSSFGGSNSFLNTATGTYRKTAGTVTTISTTFDNQGTLNVQNGTFTANGSVAQQNGNTLSGGTWQVSGNGVLNLDEAGAVNFTTNQGDVTLDGAGASFARINTLTNNQGAFRLLGARNFSAVGAFSNSGVLQLAGGSFAAPGLANSATGEIFGFGTVSPVVLNSGTVRASGGTLTASNGIDGQSGTLQSDAGATLALGADSDGDFLVNNGSLSLGTSNVTVAEDYTNANFGEGNAFDARANVSGSGQILASGDVAQALSGQLVDGGTANPGMNFGNIHVGDSVTRQYSIANTGASGPALRGAIQTSVNGGNLDDARLSGSGVTASNFGPVAAGASSAALDVTLTGSSAGALSGQSVAVVNNFDNVAEQVLSISGAVFRYANPTAHTPEPINFGNRRVGDVTNQALTISNDVANDGFSERLDATAADGPPANGSFTLLAAGASTTRASRSVSIPRRPVQGRHGDHHADPNGAGTSDSRRRSAPRRSTSVVTCSASPAPARIRQSPSCLPIGTWAMAPARR
ncbi:MAG: choice-of-anchor D domain-containing protein [Proteobacteria bacterium]|nr:choice-of-anchor D domain-containing protein [Pseudomonadota bacterium]